MQFMLVFVISHPLYNHIHHVCSCTAIPLVIAAMPVAVVAVIVDILRSFPRWLPVCLLACRKPVLIAYHHHGWWWLTTQNGNLFFSASLSSYFSDIFFLQHVSKCNCVREGSWCWEEVELRNGNGMGKMGVENWAAGGWMKVVGWFMMLDLGRMGWWLWGVSLIKKCRKAGWMREVSGR